jgi:hypothetical protein
MMGPFLLLMGLLLLYIAARGKSTDFISALFTDVTKRAAQEEQDLGQKFGTFLKYHVWNQITNAIIKGLPSFSIGLPGGGSISLGKPDLQSTDPNNPNKKG